MTPNENQNTQEEEFFKKVEVGYSQTKEQIWDQLSEKIKETKPVITEPVIIPISPWFKRVAAIAAVLLIGATMFIGLYSNTVTSQRGEMISYTLPDGSTIQLNAESSISYRPFFWQISRKISFEGEGFFQVKKGSNFAVVSDNGTTQVLGTSFNISTRNDHYEVFCATGKVRVSSTKLSDEIILTPNMWVKINGTTDLQKDVLTTHVLAWKENKFHFTAKQVNEVFQELERQYNISIELKVINAEELTYSGYFDKAENPESVLSLICESFGFTFVKQQENSYTVSQN